MALFREIDLPVGVSIAMVGALGIVGAEVGRRRSARRPLTETSRTAALVAYLREHLSGADAAIQVVEHLVRTETGREEQKLFASLYGQLKSDRHVVETLLTRFGASRRSAKRVAGRAAGSFVKRLAGGQRGDLSLFRTLEALAMGIQGKRCMWRALQALSPTLLMSGPDFAELEAAAVRQWEMVEQRRRSLVRDTFAAPETSMEGPATFREFCGVRK